MKQETINRMRIRKAKKITSVLAVIGFMQIAVGISIVIMHLAIPSTTKMHPQSLYGLKSELETEEEYQIRIENTESLYAHNALLWNRFVWWFSASAVFCLVFGIITRYSAWKLNKIVEAEIP